MADSNSAAPPTAAATSAGAADHSSATGATATAAATPTPTPATSFSSILPDESAGDSAPAPSAAPAAPASSPSPAELAVVGAYLYAKLNYLFHHYPLIDELGLVLATPSGGANSKQQSQAQAAQQQATPAPSTAAAPSTDASLPSDPSLRFDAMYPAPALLVQLQSANCSPMVVMEQSKLGIAFWSIPILVRYTMLRFQELRAQLQAQRLTAVQLTALLEQSLAEAAPGTTLADVFERSGPDTTMALPLELLCCTRVLLLINADNYTAWNIRKLLLSMPPIRSPSSATDDAAGAGRASPPAATPLLPASRELLFLNLVYSKHPKSGESWSHRRWVLSRLEGFESKYHFGPQQHQTQDGSATEAVADSSSVSSPASAAGVPTSNVSLYSTPLFQAEIAMCERSAELYPKNYYAWMHRQWMVERINNKKELELELHRVGEWTESHINDYSGFFHRQVLWNQMLSTCAPAAGDASDRQLSKADACAQVHASLPLQLRHWSKRFPHHDFSDDAAMAAAMTAMAPDSGAAATPVEAAVSADAAAAAAASTRALHASLACCSFCSLFSSLEWSHLNELQLRYPGHESLWMYRRFVWHVHVAAIGQHAEVHGATPDASAAAATSSDASASVSSSSPSIPPPASYPSIPSWLLPLAQRELSYADFQVADRELSNWAENRLAALIYKVWVVHSTLTLVYRGAMQRSATNGGGSSARTSSSSFPLFPLLSPAHRAWYLSVLHALNSVQPPIMSREHWKQRTQACINTAMEAATQHMS